MTTSIWPATHAGLMASGFLLMSLLPVLIWPWYLLLPVGGYVCLALSAAPLRRDACLPSDGAESTRSA